MDDNVIIQAAREAGALDTAMPDILSHAHADFADTDVSADELRQWLVRLKETAPQLPFFQGPRWDALALPSVEAPEAAFTWIVDALTEAGGPPTPEERAELWATLGRAGALPPADRTLWTYTQLLQSDRLRHAVPAACTGTPPAFFVTAHETVAPAPRYAPSARPYRMALTQMVRGLCTAIEAVRTDRRGLISAHEQDLLGEALATLRALEASLDQDVPEAFRTIQAAANQDIPATHEEVADAPAQP